jgi:hypothetical protein
MMKIRKEVQLRQTYMPVSAPYRNTSASRGDDVENIGFADNGKINRSSEPVYVNQGGDNGVVINSRKCPLGENFVISNESIVPVGKSKRVVVSPKSVLLEKSMTSNLTVDFSSEVVEKIAPQALKNNSSDTNEVSKKPLHSRKVDASSRGSTSSIEAPLVSNKVSIKENAMESKVHMVDEHHEKQQFKVREHKNPFKSKGILETEDRRDNSDAHGRIETPFLSNDMKNQSGEQGEHGKSKRKRQGEHGNGTEGTKTVKLVRGRFIGIVDEDEEDIKIVKSARRKYICDEDEDEGDIGGDEHNLIIGDNHNTAGAEDGIGGLIAQTAIVELYGSLPIDEPIWRYYNRCPYPFKDNLIKSPF